jgi:hypothetical protein
MLKTILISFAIILVMYAILPLTVIDIIGRFAIGWLITDLVIFFTKED